MVPDETIRDEEEKPIQIDIIHNRLDRSGQTSEVIDRHTSSIARQYFVDEHRDKLA